MANLIKTASNVIKYWWLPLVIGIALIAFGIFTFTQPEGTYKSLAKIFSIGIVFLGVAEIYFAIANRESLQGWGWYLTGGIIFLLMGGALLVNPQVSEIVLPIFFAFMILFRSIQGLGISFELKSYGILDWGNLAIFSVLGILFSFVLLINPLFDAAFLVVLTGLAFIFAGIIGVVIAIYLHKVKRFPKKLSQKLQNKIDEINQEIKEEVQNVKQEVKDFVGNVKDKIDNQKDH